MNYYYDELPTTVNDEALMGILMVVLGVLGVVLLVSVVFWIIQSMSLHTIAKRRGIRHAWLAWLPIGGYWILGSVADQYQHLAQGKIKARRKIMLVLQLIYAALVIAAIPMGIMQGMTEMTGEVTDSYILLNTVFNLLNAVVGITSLVFRHICNYDLYRSCNPKNAVVFLVLGIIIPVTEPFFYLACRKKDDGMPKPAAPDYLNEQ